MLSTLELLSATHLKYMGSKERAALGSFLDLHGDKIRTFVQDGEATNLVLSKCPNIEDFKFAPRSVRRCAWITSSRFSDLLRLPGSCSIARSSCAGVPA